MENKVKFKAREGAPFKNKDAQKVGVELYRIKEVRGKLTPLEVVKEAQNKNNFLHNYFEWNNSKAGEQYRLQQARNIINHVIEIVVINKEQTEQKAFYNVTSTNGKSEQVYVTIKEAVTTPSYRKQLLSQMINASRNLTNLIELFNSYEE